MPYKRDSQERVAEPACIHLRSKAMYVTGERRFPEHVDEEGSHTCWCNLTQHVIGPDRVDVGRSVCIQGRRCFQEVYDV